jgi:hypothetical protein
MIKHGGVKRLIETAPIFKLCRPADMRRYGGKSRNCQRNLFSNTQDVTGLAAKPRDRKIKDIGVEFRAAKRTQTSLEGQDNPVGPTFILLNCWSHLPSPSLAVMLSRDKD